MHGIKSLRITRNLNSYVKDIFTFESDEDDKNTILPFYADGLPGIVFQKSDKGVFLSPKNKYLSDFFLYGQTIHPIELSIKGAFRLIAFQLYPLAVKALIGIDPKRLNDDCFDLNLLARGSVGRIVEDLQNSKSFIAQQEIISAFLSSLILTSTVLPDQRVQHAISLILNSKGKISVKSLREDLHLTERTLERQFAEQVGVSPKQFIKIVQFNTSLNQLSESDYAKLSDIAYENQYADQSHFIRMFKKFTGKTPSEFQKLV